MVLSIRATTPILSIKNVSVTLVLSVHINQGKIFGDSKLIQTFDLEVPIIYCSTKRHANIRIEFAYVMLAVKDGISL